jgi:hypothetical protein
MSFVYYSNDASQALFLSVDGLGRILLSTGLRKRLESENKETFLHLAYEQETRRIGINLSQQKGIRPFPIDNRGYVQGKNVKNFLNDNDIDYSGGTVRYQYDGKSGDIMAFRAARPYNGENATSMRQEKNGNLERMN